MSRPAPRSRWVSSWRPTCPSVPVAPTSKAPQAHPVHISNPSRVRAPVPVSGQLCETTSGGAGHAVSGSCCLSAASVGFLDRPVPAGELGLPPGRLTGPTIRTRRGFHVPHARDTTGVGAPSAPGRRCSHGRTDASGRRLPLLSGQSCTPLPHPTYGAHLDDASSGVHSRSPVRSSPHLHPFQGVQGRTRMTVLPLRRSVGLSAGMASSRVATVPTGTRRRPSRARVTISTS